MKILHVCINAPYINGWGYQENLLPLYLSRKGIESVVIASNIMPDYLDREEVEIGESIYEGVKVIRLKCYKIGPIIITKQLNRAIAKEQPDAIFHHNLNATTLVVCERFCQKHNIPLFVDNHADSINCNQNKIYQFLYYKNIVGKIVNAFSSSVYKFYGVTHSRCSFLEQNFCVDQSKIDFLPIGVDTDRVNTLADSSILKQKYGFSADNLIIVSGGKMGKDKGTDNLIMAVEQLLKINKSIKLLLFGKFNDKDTEILANKKAHFVTTEGWCDRTKTLELLKLADIAVWPIHHTTLCEDAIACETPLLIRETGTTEHLINGNGHFMKEGSQEELVKYLKNFIELTDDKKEEIRKYCLNMKGKLSYHTIVDKVLTDYESFQKSL